MRKLTAWLNLALLAFLSACQTSPRTVFAAETSQTGRLLWKTPDHTVVSDVLLQRGQKEDTRLILTKEMGTPLLVITRSGNILEVNDRFKGRNWRGDASHMPSALIGWSSLMDAIIATAHLPEGENEIHNAAGWNAIYRMQDGSVQILDMVSTLSNERYRLILDSPGKGR